ncbi:sodium-coupled monocarboxylate transporter 1-like [Mytilus californianus]|uniref:sodium-coupled monocarboxylate transporter 1-like n=1 Tax=Mytilus californianus TaxID=6549 RepID=UPI002247149D|nr:sodium-coupled monocarboxylate transporter 1-like [Mytilus californianus]
MASRSFYLADYIIFAITIVLSVGIGLYHAFVGGKQKTTSEFHLGNRRMAIIPVAISLLVSFESSIMMLGTPAETYVFGIQNIMGNFGWFAANLLSIKIMVPLIHPLKITSAYEYLELRFNSHAVRILGTILGMLNYALYMGVVLFGPAIALEAVMGFPQFASIIIVAIAAVIYTSLGGIKAVIWTDVFQSFVMLAGIMAILIKGTLVSGGVKSTWTIANENGRLNFFVWDTDITRRHTFWNLFFGSMIRGTGLIFNQSSVQRICSTPTLKDARKVMMFVSPAFLITIAMASFEGIVAYSYYHTLGCDPIKSKQITNPNQIVPYMVMDIFNGLPGMPGLFMASLFSASLSTLSSGLSSLSALFWQDLVKPHTKPMSELKGTIISKVAVIVFGIIAVCVALLVSVIGGTLTQITGTILSAIGGPLTGLFLLGCFCPWANAKGAFIGTISGIILITWITTGQYISPNVRKAVPLPSAPIDKCYVPFTNITSLYNASTQMSTSAYEYHSTVFTTESPIVDKIPSGIDYFYSIAYPWFGVIGIFTVLIVGSIFSFLTGYTKPEESNPMYLISIVDELFFFLPESVKNVMKLGYNYKKPEMYGTKETIYDKTVYVDNELDKQLSKNDEETNNQMNNENSALLNVLEENEHHTKLQKKSVNKVDCDSKNGRLPLLSEDSTHQGQIVVNESKT